MAASAVDGDGWSCSPRLSVSVYNICIQRRESNTLLVVIGLFTIDSIMATVGRYRPDLHYISTHLKPSYRILYYEVEQDVGGAPSDNHDIHY